ncbi:MAG: glycerophosphodiester phosphodiesterase, partial [Proteobacteria bacterium]|nr:glycerophosphodiester phosphodiesterase [Pseudomonadota bacterium]
IHYLNKLSATAYHPEAGLCEAELISDLHRAGLRVNTWTVNDMAQAKAMLCAGAGIITDWPQRFT